MDLASLLIFVGIFIVISVSLICVYKLSFKEKSYEEAIAEQRQQVNALLSARPTKSKEKKIKKPKKDKSKDQKDSVEVVPVNGNAVDLLSTRNNVQIKTVEVHPKKLVLDGPVISNSAQIKKKTKKEGMTKVKPILSIKSNNLVTEKLNVNATSGESTPILNHFEEKHPKDEIELKKSAEEILKPEHAPIKKTKGDVESTKRKGHVENVINKVEVKCQGTIDKANDKNVTNQTSSVEPEAGTKPNGAVPESNATIAVSKEKKKKKLLELKDNTENDLASLLDVVRKSELTRSEVQVLIDLLLNKQHEAPILKDEWSEGKSDPIQKLKRQLADKEKQLTEQQDALTGVQNKLRSVRLEQQTERSQMLQKIRALEDQLTTSQRDGTRIQSELQSQLTENQTHMSRLADELNMVQLHRESLQSQISQLHDQLNAIKMELNESNTQNQHLKMEWDRLSQELVAEQERSQCHIVQLQQKLKETEIHVSELNAMKEIDMDQRLDVERQLQLELNRLRATCEQLQEEKHRLEMSRQQLTDELTHMKQLKEDNDELVHQLQEECANVNGSSAEEKKAREVEIINLHNELKSIQTQLEQNQINYNTELDVTSKTISSLQAELDVQKNKNNDLREKNWTVVEALKDAENKLTVLSDEAAKCASINIENVKADIVSEQKECQRVFLARLFPNIRELSANSEMNDSNLEILISSYVNSLEARTSDAHRTKELENQVDQYKQVIDGTEKMLSQLQNKVEQQETQWRQEILDKTKELDELKQNTLIQLRAQVAALESQLNDARTEKIHHLAELESLRNSKTCSSTNNSLNLINDKLAENVSNDVDKIADLAATKATESCPGATNGLSTIIEGGAH